ncbi:MAG: glycosyl transferase family 2 [Alphaproteobacteria bacterium]|nr:MAG: glycosyl transferase family 2 [Alphaproteobacteria bacterium]
MSILVVIVNYRTAKLVVACLDSLALEVAANPGTKVTIVDNASGDGSGTTIAAAIAEQGWENWAELVESPVNGGFAAGVNVGVRPALASGDVEFLWLLNPDTVVRPGAIAALAGFMRARPTAGIAGSLLELADGTPWPFAFRFPGLLGEVEQGLRLGLATRLLRRHAVLRRMGSEPAQVDWVSGASFMVRRSVFEAIGLMDEAYFLYFEETDFCRAANRAGWECWYIPDAKVMHIAGQSTGVTGADAARQRRPGYWFESRRRYFVKNHGSLYAAATDLAWLVAYSVWTLRRKLTGAQSPDPPGLARDLLWHSPLLRWHSVANRDTDRDAHRPRLEAH